MKEITTQGGTRRNQEESGGRNQKNMNTIKIVNEEELGVKN
jgi:hypothetical protein